MKRVRLFVVAWFALLGLSCSNDRPVGPEQPPDQLANPTAAPYGLLPDGLYSLAWTDADNGVYGGFELISQKNGRATPIWNLWGQQTWVVDPPTLWGPSPVGFAFDLDGTMYTIIGVYYFDDQYSQSRFARIDGATGEVTYIGDPVRWNYCGPDIDSQGNFYVCGMDVPHLGYIHGPGALFRVDKVTGEFTEIGPTTWQGETITDWMDLAFDSNDQLWGTTQNKLFKIDTATGAITDVIPITGVPGDPPPPPYHLPQEVMTIAFDDHDILYGTAINVEWDTGHGAPVLTIDVETGQATFLGYTEQVYNHGGDILAKFVRIAHRSGNGTYECMVINMRDLSAHLAHGDYVPGTAGYSYDCP